jgi:hypothetical protein
MTLEAFMRLWRRKSNSAWFIDTRPAIRSSELRTAMMVFAVWVGFIVALHYAGSPRLYAAVQHLNRALEPLINFNQPPAALDIDALIVTADHNTELTSVATLSPRGYHPVLATGAKDALDRVATARRPWKMIVVDASLPGAAGLMRAVRAQLPATTIVVVQGNHGAHAVSRVLLDQLNTPPRQTVAN